MKNTYLISYDLKKADSESYQTLFEFIKSFSTWAHITDSLWAVKSEMNAEQIRDKILELVPNGSALIVVKSGVESAWSRTTCSSAWLEKNL